MMSARKIPQAALYPRDHAGAREQSGSRARMCHDACHLTEHCTQRAFAEALCARILSDFPQLSFGVSRYQILVAK
jgi:hypothetical protein